MISRRSCDQGQAPHLQQKAQQQAHCAAVLLNSEQKSKRQIMKEKTNGAPRAYEKHKAADELCRVFVEYLTMTGPTSKLIDKAIQKFMLDNGFSGDRIHHHLRAE